MDSDVTKNMRRFGFIQDKAHNEFFFCVHLVSLNVPRAESEHSYNQ